MGIVDQINLAIKQLKSSPFIANVETKGFVKHNSIHLHPPS